LGNSVHTGQHKRERMLSSEVARVAVEGTRVFYPQIRVMLLDQRKVRAYPTRVADSQAGGLETAKDFSRLAALKRIGFDQHQCFLDRVHVFRQRPIVLLIATHCREAASRCKPSYDGLKFNVRPAN